MVVVGMAQRNRVWKTPVTGSLFACEGRSLTRSDPPRSEKESQLTLCLFAILSPVLFFSPLFSFPRERDNKQVERASRKKTLLDEEESEKYTPRSAFWT